MRLAAHHRYLTLRKSAAHFLANRLLLRPGVHPEKNLVLGGTHLLPAKDDQIRSIGVSLRETWGVRYLAPVHCTGEPAFAILKETFGDHYVYAGLGTTVLLGPKITVKAEAGQPNKEAMDEGDLRSYRDAMLRGPLRALLGGGKRLARAQQ
jgi:7,8-dihydropterin-6-yl-methyl-4-(beta-D-ribofuranosyl)aminobenzene 5'-phosphate synthase